MSQLEKALRAALDGKELSWAKIVPLLERFGATVVPGKGSHFKILYPGRRALPIPVHNGKIKPAYAMLIADLLNDIMK